MCYGLQFDQMTAQWKGYNNWMARLIKTCEVKIIVVITSLDFFDWSWLSMNAVNSWEMMIIFHKPFYPTLKWANNINFGLSL